MGAPCCGPPLVDCKNCGHEFLEWHVDTFRRECTDAELDRRKCNDCLKCWPPDDPDAPKERVPERVPEAVPA